MSTRTSIKDVRDAFARFVKAHESAGLSRTVSVEHYDRPRDNGKPWQGYERSDVTLTSAHLILEEGSQTYGRAFRVFYREPTNGAHYNIGHGEYLGWTRAEAESALNGLTNGIRLATEDK